MAAQVILLVALVAFSFAGIVHADDLKLPGSTIKTKYAVAKADAIFTGQVEQEADAIFTAEVEQNGVTKASGENLFCGIKIKVVDVFKGTVDSKISVSMVVKMVEPVIEAAPPPQSNKTYILFVIKKTGKDNDPFTALKLLHATDDNIVMVKKLVTQLPKN